jgi:hypothetical protein
VSRIQVRKYSPRIRQVRLGSSRSISLLVAATLSIGLLALPITPSQAAKGDAVNITGMNISAAADSGGTISNNHVVFLRGTFTNTSNQAISTLELNLVSTPAIGSRGELAGLIADPTSASNLIPSDISAILRNVAPGATKNWQITFRGEEVLGTTAAGVYGFGVQPDQPATSKATVVTTPWFFNTNVKPTNVAMVLPITTLNNHLANNEIPDLKKDLVEAERLTNLISGQSGSQISWIQDAALRPWVNNLAAASDSSVPTQLNNALDSLSPATPFLPFGHTDLTALSLANQQDDFFDAINLTRALAVGRQVFYAPTSGESDPKTISSLNEQGIRTIVSNEFLRGNKRETTSAVATSASNSVLVFDLATSDCLVNAGESDEEFFRAVTCLTSEIGMMTAESPQDSRSIIVLAPAEWSVSTEQLSALITALSNNNWMQLATLDLVAAQAPAQNFVSLVDDYQSQVTRAAIRQANELRSEAEILSSLYVDSELSNSFDSARILGFSDLWKTSADATNYLSQNLKILNSYLRAVSIESSSRITTPEETSEIPITVVNKSDKAVSVSVNLTSAATSRFSSEPTELIQIESGQRVTIPVAITLVGAGVVNVRAQLIAPNGEAFGAVENIQISSAAYSQFARTLVWGAFGLLILLALSNLIKRRKDRRPSDISAR